MKNFFVVTATIEFLTALALVVALTFTVSLLLGASLNEAAAIVVARVAGVVLVTVSIACWYARNDIQSRTASGLLIAMLFYNVAIIFLFAYAAFASSLNGVGTYPAILVHAAMAGWCITCLLKKQSTV